MSLCFVEDSFVRNVIPICIVHNYSFVERIIYFRIFKEFCRVIISKLGK
jgi:hypothetical protein